ncbi:MAG: hypothetical protein NWF01_09570 [Candidatus Bathyarchaeota archaeon]|nr:hypothetical protein [Candidatus Bathyarchaeota archaeon]
MEEQKKGTNEVTLSFALNISTKPNVVKYAIAGDVTLTGKSDDIKKRLEVNPKTNIPQILFTIYQHVFNSIYILSSNLNTPYPPPDLLHPMAEKIQIIPATQPEKEQTAKTEEQAATAPNATPDASAVQAQAAPNPNPAPAK